MIISVSGIRQFRRCPRQWCYDNLIASARANDGSTRREAFLLSQLESIVGWRGNLVDQVISNKLVPKLKERWLPTAETLLAHARSLFDRQLSFARARRMWEPGMKKTGNEDFGALFFVEYDERVDEAELEQAWIEVEQAIRNLLDMEGVLARLRKARHIVAQRSLSYDHLDVTFRAVPDVIAFYDKEPPLIVDWKVHTKGLHEYRFQLCAYALALTRCNPHDDFPLSLKQVTPTEMQLLEVQLLTKRERAYSLTEDDLIDVDNFIAAAAVEMKMMNAGRKTSEVDPFDFEVTRNPETCQICPFRRLCREESSCPKLTQTTFF